MKLQPSISCADLASGDIADGSLVQTNNLLGFAAKTSVGERVLVYLDAGKSRFEFEASTEGLTALSYGTDLTLRPCLESFDPTLPIGQPSRMEMVFLRSKLGVIVHLPLMQIRFYDFESGRLTPWSGQSVAQGFKKWRLGIERGRDEFIVLMQSGG
jgi:hypothetical protein